MSDPLGEHDNIVAGFQIEGRTVRGRVARLGSVLDDILSAHDYPEPVARLLGEAVLVTTLVGDALKFDGRLIVQAQGDGPVRFLVAEYVTGEGVRGFASMDREAVEAVMQTAGRVLAIPAGNVFMASTGVIGEPLPAERVTAKLQELAAALSPDLTALSSAGVSAAAQKAVPDSAASRTGVGRVERMISMRILRYRGGNGEMSAKIASVGGCTFGPGV